MVGDGGGGRNKGGIESWDGGIQRALEGRGGLDGETRDAKQRKEKAKVGRQREKNEREKGGQEIGVIVAQGDAPAAIGLVVV
jgi:hypothetical protein